MEAERRLAAIMFTDIVGYSAITHKHEHLAQVLLEEYRKMLRSLFHRHGGREVKTIGDAFLVEFPSALGAVTCAKEIQRELHTRNRPLREDAKIVARIGIHVGDVIYKGNDVYGDAVNVAARIEAIAEPGGICISQQVYDQIRNKMGVRSTRLGSRDLKNIDTPIDLYNILPEEEGESSMVTADKCRVAILPLANIGRDPENEYFADGLTEELISTVSRVRGLAVTSRTSVMKYKNVAKAIPEVGRELGVGTVLEGSVRRGGVKVRVAVQLIEVQSDKHLWSQSYDREIEDIFAIQSDIAQNVASSLELQLLAEDRQEIQRKATEDIDAYKMYLKGRFYWNERNPESVKKAMKYFEEAIGRDSDFAQALVGLADCYLILIDQAVLDLKDAGLRLRSLLDNALRVNDRLAEAHASLGNLFIHEWNWSSAETEFRRAIELNPNYATAHQWYCLLLSFTDRPDDALYEVRAALRLDPVSPIMNMNLANLLLQAGRFEESIEQFKRTLALEPMFGLAHVHLGGAYVSRSRFDEGIAELQRAREILGSLPWSTAILAYTYGLMGDRETATKLLSDLEQSSKSTFVPNALLGTIYFALGEKEKAFSLFEMAYEEHSNVLPYIKVLAVFRNIRADPKFGALLQRVGHLA